MAMNPDYNHPTEIIGQIQNLRLVFFLCTICGTKISKGTENVTLGFHTSTGIVSDVLLHALFINANTLILIKGPSKIFQKYPFWDFKK